MGVAVAQSYLSDILHIVSQGLLIPTIILLLGFIAYALFCIGSIIAEYFTERKNFKVEMPKFLAALMAAKQDEIPEVIMDSGLLNRQKVALLTVYDYRTLPGDAFAALIHRLVDDEQTHYDRISSRNNVAARVSPMIGLMGTLIPLGPGIEALGRADTSALSSSLLIAFDTTVAGLVVAAICMIVGKIRSNWYGNYMSALDAAMATMMQKVEDLRAAGEITIEEPSDYAFLYESKHAARAKADSSSAKSDESSDEKGASEALGKENAAAEKAREDESRTASEARAWAEAAAVAQAQTQARMQSEEQARAQELARAQEQAAALARQQAEAEALARQQAEAEALARRQAEAEALAQQQAETRLLAQQQAEAQARARLLAEQQAQAAQQVQTAQQAQTAQSAQQPLSSNWAQVPPRVQAQSQSQAQPQTQQQPQAQQASAPQQNAFVLRQPVGLGDSAIRAREAAQRDQGDYSQE